ncbi:MAG: 4-hydroxy-3-methylbut-2-enyl diphosphate reductase [Chitinophagaceae bacterium]|nr:4-hydroxy-3-methylbut-2-enyl diphosphate reductase [Chitinophagaceae bacterium]
MKSFDIPIIYRSPLISAIKKKRREADRMKKDFTPTRLDFGNIQIYLARHFGFCYGVENAIEIAFKTVSENPGKRIFLLSEMIHNPHVNEDLKRHGVRFLQDTAGHPLIPFDELTADDIVMIPAFGTTLETEQKLKQLGIAVEKYDTTCPFVEKVWNRSQSIAQKNYTIIIHGKPYHEETRATFSHASAFAPSLVIRDMNEALMLAAYIKKEKPLSLFYEEFKERYSPGFDPEKDLRRIGVVNQTTMLASDTQAIADYLKQVMLETFRPEKTEDCFADTRDTLCYATLDNQTAVQEMLNIPAHLAIVVGGYNSSNTSHLVALCKDKLPTYFISDENCIISPESIRHFDLTQKKEVVSENWLPPGRPLKVLMTSGASCPDALVERVIEKIVGLIPENKKTEELLPSFL